ncbi:MAG: sigma-70 family RNA polymerase sigma factor [Chitinivibrionales bacterium]|nr:sigma-70 family RNA polymerase sigma factor [Chitinivibrionales bacterium]
MGNVSGASPRSFSCGYVLNETEFKKIYHDLSGKLYNYLLWMTRNKDASDDILQTVFVKVWKNTTVPEKFNEIEPWLFRVARNACMDYFRARRRVTKLRMRYAGEHTPSVYNTAEKKSTWELLGMLSKEERSIIYLHLKMGYNYKEIADILRIKENAVRVKAFRALKRLRKRYIKELL